VAEKQRFSVNILMPTYKPYIEELKIIRVNQICQHIEGLQNNFRCHSRGCGRKHWHKHINGRIISFDIERGNLLRLYLNNNPLNLTWNLTMCAHGGKLWQREIPYDKYVFYILSKNGERRRFLYIYTNGDAWNIGVRDELRPRYTINRLSRSQRQKLPPTFEIACLDNAKFRGNHLRHPGKLKKRMRLERKDKAMEIFNSRGR
jgi:hypothetical protein